MRCPMAAAYACCRTERAAVSAIRAALRRFADYRVSPARRAAADALTRCRQLHYRRLMLIRRLPPP